jgi:CheY-like chemotaxis protein
MAMDDDRNRDLLVDVRRAFHHLYDPVELRKNPLMTLLGMDAPGQLRQVLQESVEQLRPPAEIAQHSDAWRTYRVLHHRYIEQFDQQGVAGNLGLSIRQLRRQEVVALQSVVDLICARFGLNCAAKPVAAPLEEHVRDDGAITASLDVQLIQQSDPMRSTDLALIIESVMETLAAKAAACATRLILDRAEVDVFVESSPQMLRQALLMLAPLLMERARSAGLRFLIQRDGDSVRLYVTVSASIADPNDWWDDRAELARRILALSGAELVLRAHEFVIRFIRVDAAPVLVVDDNVDAHRLYGRFVTHTRYRLLHAYNAGQAEMLLRSATPHVVVLDVMLPDVDGWEMLGRLRENPQTANVPVVVCTILPQEDFALTLRAAAFLRKPITAENFVATLDRLTAASVR